MIINLVKINTTKVKLNFKQKTDKCNNCRGKPPINNHLYCISDTVATQNYIKFHTSCINKFNVSIGPQVLLPDGSPIQETHRLGLNISPLLTIRGNIAHIFPHIQSGALISIGKICDYGCTSIFTATHMMLLKQGSLVLEGNQKVAAFVWQVNIFTASHPSPIPTRQSENNLMEDRTEL